MSPLGSIIEAIQARRAELSPARALLVGVSGIDASGKGFIAAQLTRDLRARGLETVCLNVDGWLVLPHERFSETEPARHFYEQAIRFDEMFTRLVLPLRDDRRVTLAAQLAQETASRYHRHTFDYAGVDVVLVEGVFLFKRAYRPHFDLSYWVACTFETALERAIGRAQEGLPPLETVRAFQTIYFPAQRIHIERDEPILAADALILNDDRLAEARRAERQWLSSDSAHLAARIESSRAAE